MGPGLLPRHATPCYACPADDASIIKAPGSGWKERALARGKRAMADKGVKTAGYVRPLGSGFVCPPFCHDGKLTALEVEEGERVARPRSHVERLIGFVQRNRFMQHRLHPAHFPKMSQVIYISTMLLHFVPSWLSAGGGGEE